MQPSLATLCFASYGRRKAPFTADAGIQEKAARLAKELDEWLGPAGADRALFVGRIGIPRSVAVLARSVRRPVEELMKASAAPGYAAE
jgi:hypothetical protein